jgi:biotin carboxyl carrier protein
VNVEVMVNGRPWKVALEPAKQAGQVTVTIEGISRVVDASWIDTDTLSLVDGGASREIRFHRRDGNGAIGVEVGGTLFEAVVPKRNREGFSTPNTRKNPPGSSSGAAAAGPGVSQPIKSPMPGRVVRVLVAVGDHVAARQGVVVVEAMKMENELRTPAAGVVTEILVAPGAAVETGALLVVVGR